MPVRAISDTQNAAFADRECWWISDSQNRPRTAGVSIQADAGIHGGVPGRASNGESLAAAASG